MTESTRRFLARLPKGAYYVLSAEGPGFGFTGKVAEEAAELTRLNFERLKTHRGPEWRSTNPPVPPPTEQS
jgi:hypothetical protein